MTGFRTISGKAAWGNQNVRSQDVKSYQATHGGARPEPEFRKAGGKVEIRVGAHALTARNIPHRRAWSGFKTFLQSISLLRFVGVGETRRAASRMRKAGREFDKGVSTLVSDLANGKVKNDGDMADRIGALHDSANELRKNGGDIEKRFETNLMESLKALQTADPDKAGAVLKDLQTFAFDGMQDYFFRPQPQDVSKTQDAVASNLAMAYGSDVDQRAEANFAKSMIPALRRASVFGPSIDKHAAFGGSQMKGVAFGYDVSKLKAFDGNAAAFKEFGGDPAKAKAFNNDISAHRSFGGDLEAYKQFGGSGELFEAFPGAPESLQGDEGAERLKTWIDETYGRGQGEIFLNRHPEFRHGVDEPELAGLGHAVQNELEAFAQRGYQFNDSRFDALTSVSVDDPARTLLKQNFDKYAEEHEALDSVTWLGDLNQAIAQKDKMNDDDLRSKIRSLAEPLQPAVYSFGLNKQDAVGGSQRYGDLNIASRARNNFIKEICSAARKDYNKSMTLDDGLNLLDDLTGDELKQVLSTGFGGPDKNETAVQQTRGNAMDAYKRFIDEKDLTGDRIATKNADAESELYMNVITAHFGDRFGSAIGKSVVNTHLDGKTEMPKLPLTDKDLRIIEDKVFRLESTLHGFNIEKKMKDKTKSVPTVMRQQWDAQLKKGVAAPSADFQITVGPNEKSGEESVVTYLDRRVEAEKPSAQAANICGQFMRDVDRSTVLIAGDDDNDDVQLTRANASDQLSTLCDDDKTVALNLSKFAQQGLFNALHGAVNMKMADQSAPIVMMDVHNDGGKKASDLSAQKMSISKSNDGVYKIDYKWKVNSGTVLGQDGAVYLNPDESGVSAHVSLTVNEEDLRAGNLKNYQLSNVTFNVKAVLDPYKTVVNQ